MTFAHWRSGWCARAVIGVLCAAAAIAGPRLALGSTPEILEISVTDLANIPVTLR